MHSRLVTGVGMAVAMGAFLAAGSAAAAGPEVVSGPGALQFLVDGNGDFFWEDLQAASDVPVRFYRNYQATGSTPGPQPEPFLCVNRQTASSTT